MNKNCELLAARNEGLLQWRNVIRKELSFSQADVSTPAGIDPDVFSGKMIIDELDNSALKINIKSSAQKTYLAHDDFVQGKRSKFFIINSCANLLFRNKEKRIIVPSGDSIIVPAWNDYIEESFSNRTSLSIIMDVNSVFDTPDDISDLLWKRVSTLKYGFEINKVLTNFYENSTSRFSHKNYNVLSGLLALEIEDLPRKSNSPEDCGGSKLSSILSFIKNNIKNPDLRLSSVAEMLGVTERMVQYILAENGLKFHDVLAQERCNLLASKIREDVFSDINVLILESGFESIATGCRTFKKFYKMTPKQYQKNLIN
ncbi:helix-turn-helix transcriptional regulator [Hafnia paralvei]|uniref:helix-turn-helix domain-containing protein n=1 Tax=Hafnia paralvei TaxID=546367 RepID=UPI001419FBAB|nr:AraC family transcriptional regulator [Hafnia paralvei]NIH33122.1 helix-turn-helix transcriptional regulator [Hafnia paralvei]